jgi:hypothetical protein
LAPKEKLKTMTTTMTMTTAAGAELRNVALSDLEHALESAGRIVRLLDSSDPLVKRLTVSVGLAQDSFGLLRITGASPTQKALPGSVEPTKPVGQTTPAGGPQRLSAPVFVLPTEGQSKSVKINDKTIKVKRTSLDRLEVVSNSTDGRADRAHKHATKTWLCLGAKHGCGEIIVGNTIGRHQETCEQAQRVYREDKIPTRPKRARGVRGEPKRARGRPKKVVAATTQTGRRRKLAKAG